VKLKGFPGLVSGSFGRPGEKHGVEKRATCALCGDCIALFQSAISRNRVGERGGWRARP